MVGSAISELPSPKAELLVALEQAGKEMSGTARGYLLRGHRPPPGAACPYPTW